VALYYTWYLTTYAFDATYAAKNKKTKNKIVTQIKKKKKIWRAGGGSTTLKANEIYYIYPLWVAQGSS
jgi:hypothetical protein